MKIIFILPLLVIITIAAETRFKVGHKRWAFHINTNDGKHEREEFVDENGVAYGKIISGEKGEVRSEGSPEASGKPKEFRYKFDNTGGDPDFTFYTDGTDEKPPQEGGQQRREISERDTETEERKNEEKFPSKFNYSFIDDKSEFSGHVMFKIGNDAYNFNFLTGDKRQTREETLNDKVLTGKITYLDEKDQLRVVRYRFNLTGPRPEFEVSMDKRGYDKPKYHKSPYPIQGQSNAYAYDDPNRFHRRVLGPSPPYGIPPQQYQSGIPPQIVRPNVPPQGLSPHSGNSWVNYRVQ